MTPLAAELACQKLLPPRKRRILDPIDLLNVFSSPLCFDCTAIGRELPSNNDWLDNLLVLPADEFFFDWGNFSFNSGEQFGRVDGRYAIYCRRYEAGHNFIAPEHDILFAAIVAWDTKGDVIIVEDSYSYLILDGESMRQIKGVFASGEDVGIPKAAGDKHLSDTSALILYFSHLIAQGHTSKKPSHKGKVKAIRAAAQAARRPMPANAEVYVEVTREVVLAVPVARHSNSTPPAVPPAPPIDSAIGADDGEEGRAGGAHGPHRRHEVRSFLRHMKSGKVVPVKGHWRGKAGLGESRHFFTLKPDNASNATA